MAELQTVCIGLMVGPMTHTQSLSPTKIPQLIKVDKLYFDD